MEREKVLLTISRVLLRSVLSLAILGGSVWFLFYLGKPDSSKRQEGRLTKTPSVETAQAELHTTGIDFEVDGIVVPYREVVVSPEVSGRVIYKSPNCRQGRFVKKGESLFRIDPANYQLEVRRLEAAFSQTQANIHECDVEIRNLTEQIALAKDQVAIQQREVKRYESVDDPGVYSESEIDMARNSELAARNSLQQFESQQRLKTASKKRLQTASQSAQIQLDRAKLDLQRTEICAPLSGVITKYSVEQDSYAQAGAAAITIQDTSRLEILCSLHMQQVGWLWQTPSVAQAATQNPLLAASAARRFDVEAQAVSKNPSQATGLTSLSQATGLTGLSQTMGLTGMSQATAPQTSSPNAYQLPSLPVTVTYRLDNACWAWQGSLTSYDGSSVDESTRMMPCRVTVENPLEAKAVNTCGTTMPNRNAPPTLMTKMFVEVQIHSKPAISLLRIQEKALIPGNRVWTATGGLLKRHQVQVAQVEDGEVIIYAEGAEMVPGDQVVVSPLATPTEGMKVKLMPIKKSSPTPTVAPVAIDNTRHTF